MSNEVISHWVEKAKLIAMPDDAPVSGIKIIRSDSKSRGNLIMEVSEKLRPFITKMFEGVRDGDGILVQPAHVRGIALNVAQQIVTNQERKVS